MIDDGLNSSGYVLTTLSTGTYDEVQYVDYVQGKSPPSVVAHYSFMTKF